MTKLADNELKQVNGGAIKSIWVAIPLGITFIVGIIDGFIRPLKCNS